MRWRLGTSSNCTSPKPRSMNWKDDCAKIARTATSLLPVEVRGARDPASGGQGGYAGVILPMSEQPDTIKRHRPDHCEHCQAELEGGGGQVVERRQVWELPEIRVQVEEHQIEEVNCPQCHHRNRGTFPEEVKAPVHYGPRVAAMGVYFNQLGSCLFRRFLGLSAVMMASPLSLASAAIFRRCVSKGVLCLRLSLLDILSPFSFDLGSYLFSCKG